MTFNHGHGLLAGGLSALHYRPILLRMYSTPPGDRYTHSTSRPLINQTSASSQLFEPNLVEAVKCLDKINGNSLFICKHVAGWQKSTYVWKDHPSSCSLHLDFFSSSTYPTKEIIFFFG